MMANILLDTRTVDRYKQRIAELEAQLKESQALVQLGRDRIEVLEAELALWDGREAYLVGKIDELEARIVSDRELLAQAMLDMGMSTGHGGSTSDLVDELKLNVAELKENG